MSFASRLGAMVLLASVSLCAAAQTAAPVTMRNVVSLAASGQIEVQQDWLTMTLSATREGTEAAAVQSQVRQALEQALAEVRGAAQPGQMELRTGAFGLHPRYGKDNKIMGWVGTSELVLEGRDFVRIGTAAGKVQSMTVAGVQFSLSRDARGQVEAQAQSMAVERFKARAQELAKGFGFTGYTLREINVSSDEQGGRPMPRLMAANVRMAMADAAVPLESGKALVQVTISGAVELK